MDYSLLIVIESKELKITNSLQLDELYESQVIDPLHKKHIFESEHEIYHFSIIDYLQDWDLNKRAERFFKTVVLRKDPNNLSAIDPDKYAQRFLHFVHVNVLNWLS